MRVLSLPPGPGPLDNPLKGWATYTDAGSIRQTYSLVYFYVPWKELEPQPGRYAFDAWEKKVWDTPAARDKHVIFRVYLDYPSLPTGVPDWLLAEGVKLHRYADYGGGESPDYDDPRLVSALTEFIGALGKHYDRNPRVAFIALGTLGFWGEWHTYPETQLFASPATQAKVVEAYHEAFPDKILVGRYATGFLGHQPWIGYHDDMIPSDTLGPDDWMFLPQMRASGRADNWKVAVTGGEMVPGEADNWLGDGYPTLLAAVEQAHFTWIGPYSPAIDQNQTPELIARGADIVRRMGYQYCLTQLTCPGSVASGSRVRISIDGVNEGVAPFYYPWEVRIALLNSRHEVAESFPVDVDIRKWLPGGFKLSAEPAVLASPGVYNLAIGIVDPYTGKPAIRFANDLPYDDGWTVLSTVRVTKGN